MSVSLIHVKCPEQRRIGKMTPDIDTGFVYITRFIVKHEFIFLLHFIRHRILYSFAMYSTCKLFSFITVLCILELLVMQATAKDEVPLYRYYNSKSGDHFYTTSLSELGGGRDGYVSEGIAGKCSLFPATGTSPFYRYFNGRSGDHFYTTNLAELGGGGGGYVFEGVQCYVYSQAIDGTLPFYRYFNSGNGDHFYTTNFAELGGGKGGYKFEKIAAYIAPA